MQFWHRCSEQLEKELSAQQFNTWIRPLQVIEDDSHVKLLAPNRFVLDWVKNHYLESIQNHLSNLCDAGTLPRITIEIGSKKKSKLKAQQGEENTATTSLAQHNDHYSVDSNLNPNFSFETFVEGKSNQIARAASIQISENPGKAYNPLFIYGGVGLGKTHLMHAVGNSILARNPSAKVLYLHSERFVAEMVKALQHNTIDQFKKKYRSLNALLIDDIQFFAG